MELQFRPLSFNPPMKQTFCVMSLTSFKEELDQRWRETKRKRKELGDEEEKKGSKKFQAWFLTFLVELEMSYAWSEVVLDWEKKLW